MGMFGRSSADGEVVDIVDGRGIRRGGRFRVAESNTLPSMTKQEFAAECDINNIMAQYNRTGLVNHVSKYQGRYVDVCGAVSFQEAQNIVLRAQEAFMSLPAEVRGKFENDPGAFLDFVSDPSNKDEMRKLGLLKGVEDVGGKVSEDVRTAEGSVEKPDVSNGGKST